ncbi:unnamed protein product [Leptidea sinapis]|uniref:Radical SAM core domain-containing protein n=1 Tax=Leptidea sinapis TaxID=189913 RepID=A0A5E4R8M3_9NEOP|nr:unnamed protein product [Leptidea sinapis]
MDANMITFVFLSQNAAIFAYCMPAEGVELSARSELLGRDELVRLVRVLAACGVSKLRLTGGEPTLRRDLPDLVQQLSSVAGVRTVAMTSNGPVKINTVLMKGFNDDEVCDFVELTRERLVEVRTPAWWPAPPCCGSCASDTRACSRWRPPRAAPPRAGVRGLGGAHLSAVSQCVVCQVCLFGSAEVSLRDAMRAGADDRELGALVRGALRRKLPQHAGEARTRTVCVSRLL